MWGRTLPAGLYPIAMSLSKIGRNAWNGEGLAGDGEGKGLWARASRSLSQGKHPKHPKVCDPALLGTVERYFLEIGGIPRLRQRISCCVFSRTFHAAAARARLPPFLTPHAERGS